MDQLLFTIISIGGLLLTGFLLSRVLRASNPAAWVVFLFLTVTGQIVASGILLSALNLLGSILHWTLFIVGIGFVVLVTVSLISPLRRLCFPRIKIPGFVPRLKIWFRHLTRFERAALSFLLTTVLLVNVLNLTVVIFTPPAHWDSMVFHLTRVGYWLQHGNFDYYEANTCFQVTHQKLKGLLLLFIFLATGRNENLTQLVQYIAYWTAVFSVYGISRSIGLKQSAALFTALIFALLTECLMESTTPQSDMVLTAYLGCLVYSLFNFKNSRRKKFLCLAGVSLGLAVATKPPALLVFPSLAVILVYILFSDKEPITSKIKNGFIFLLVSLIAIGILALPTGYGENYRVFGHPLGSEQIRKYHGFEGRSFDYVFRNGTKNLLRYCYDFISLDGLPPTAPIRKAQAALKTVPRTLFNTLGFKLEAEEGDGVREGPFVYDKPPYAHTDYSYWGVFGFALIWPTVILVLVGAFKSPAGRVLSIATILFLLMQAYSGPYEPGRGRYFIAAAIFAAPVTGYLFLTKNKFLRAYILLIVVLGCFSALTAVLFRYRTPLLTRDSVFFKNRLEQLSRDGPIFQEPIKRFEELVPPDAVVAACLNPNSFEYPLFGRKLTRTIIPLNSYWRGLQPVPENADYLLWADDFDEVLNRNEADIHLGKDWYLRKLK